MTTALRIGTFELGRRPCIVAAGGEAEVHALCSAEGADVVELRADLFAEPSVDGARRALERLRSGARPIVLTVRASTEGGRAMPERLRHEIYEAGLDIADAIDLEIASVALAEALVPAVRRAGKTVVLSTHDFETTPPRTELLARVARAFDAGADVAKVVSHATSLAELQVLIDVTRGVAPSPVATLAMGPLGPLSRLVLPAAGSLLTYASVGTPTAPGQLPVSELRTLFQRLLPG